MCQKHHTNKISKPVEKHLSPHLLHFVNVEQQGCMGDEAIDLEVSKTASCQWRHDEQIVRDGQGHYFISTGAMCPN